MSTDTLEARSVADFLSPEEAQADVSAQIDAEQAGEEAGFTNITFDTNDPLYETKFEMHFAGTPLTEKVLNGEVDLADLTQGQEIRLDRELNVLEQVLSGDLQMGEMGFNQATILVRMLGDKQTVPGMKEQLLGFAQKNQYGLERMAVLLQESADINAAKVSAGARFSAGDRLEADNMGFDVSGMDAPVMQPLDPEALTPEMSGMKM